MLKNLIYAIMLGVGMAACLSQNDKNNALTEVTDAPATTDSLFDDKEAISAPSPEEFIVEKDKVGHVRINMPIENFRQHIPAGLTITDTTLHLEGQASTAYLLRPEGESKGILVEQQCKPACEVWRIQVQHPAYKTRKNIGIGSTFSELQKAYTINYVSPGEVGYVAVATDQEHSFILDRSRLPKERLAQLKPADIPADTRITGIIVY